MAIKNKLNRTDLIKKLGKYPTGNICNAHSKVRAMDSRIAALSPGMKLAGPAKTAAIIPGQNAAIHRAIHNSRRGDILVVDGKKSLSYGPFGDILATCCQQLGLSGLVIDSTVRDSSEIVDLGFPVFCLGTHPAATEKTDPGEIEIPIVCGEVNVHPDDIIIADNDGVVVIPHLLIEEVFLGLMTVVEKEKKIMKRLKNGETTCEIFKIKP